MVSFSSPNTFWERLFSDEVLTKLLDPKTDPLENWVLLIREGQTFASNRLPDHHFQSGRVLLSCPTNPEWAFARYFQKSKSWEDVAKLHEKKFRFFLSHNKVPVRFLRFSLQIEILEFGYSNRFHHWKEVYSQPAKDLMGDKALNRLDDDLNPIVEGAFLEDWSHEDLVKLSVAIDYQLSVSR